jgi:putative membrane protein
MPPDATPDRHTQVAANRTAEAAERTKETAVRTTVAAQHTEASADRRTELAANRTVLAAERTYAAWVRTGLVSLAAGVGAKTTLGGVLPNWVVVLTGSVLVVFAAFCFAAAVWRELSPGAPPPQPDVRRLPRVLLFALNGFLALVALAALLGIWFGRTGGS